MPTNTFVLPGTWTGQATQESQNALQLGVANVSTQARYSHARQLAPLVHLTVQPTAYPGKRVLDVCLALVALLACALLLLAIAVLIVLDSGLPVLFFQERVGCRGRRFKMLKFRTMRRERRHRAEGPPLGLGERRRRHKSSADPRVTRVGRFLRRSCLDELPQLWNVLRGDMSLVGPRPELPEIVARYEPWQHARHLVYPGLTGWWQVNRDGGKLMHEATHFDLHYVANCSLALDVAIVARTLTAVVRGRGAF